MSKRIKTWVRTGEYSKHMRTRTFVGTGKGTYFPRHAVWTVISSTFKTKNVSTRTAVKQGASSNTGTWTRIRMKRL